MNNHPQPGKKILSSILLISIMFMYASPLRDLTVRAQEFASSTASSSEGVSVDAELPLLEAESVEGLDSTTQDDEVFLEPTDHIAATSTAASDDGTTGNISIEATSTEAVPESVDATSTSQSEIENVVVNDNEQQPIVFDSTGTTTLATTTILGDLSTSTPTTTEPLDLDIDASTAIEEVDATKNATGTPPVGTTTISTGDAVATANILNLLNTNLVNSTGSLIMAHLPNGHDGTIDFRESSTPLSSPACALLICNGITDSEINLESDGVLENDITITATSGENLIENADTAVIETGDSYAGLNLVNVANTNIVDSNYLLVSLNSFKDVNGDIIFPSISSFFTAQNSISTPSYVTSSSSASLDNLLDVEASSGNNNASSSRGSITTGGSISALNVYNAANSLLVGGSSVSLLLKVSGTWIGELFGVPDENTFTEESNSKELYFEDDAASQTALNATTTVTSTSTALISNTVHVRANSGDNESSNVGTTTIRTGTAHAVANIINIANANIIGRNWILAIINIFGDFNGNISFGRPDLWLGEKVSADSTFITNGTKLTYVITLVNRGDMAASDIKLASSYDAQHLTISEASVPYEEATAGMLVFQISGLRPGEADEIVFQATIKDTSPGTDISNTATVTARQPDNNPNDNSDTTTITTSTPPSSGGGGTLPRADPPATSTPSSGSIGSIDPLMIAVSRVTASTTVMGSDSPIDQVLIIRNVSGNAIPLATFDDIMYDPHGNEAHRETWDLQQLLPHEEITLTYKISFGSQVPSGLFMLSSEFRHSGDQKIHFNSNGSITYTAPTRQLTATPTPPERTVVLSPAMPVEKINPPPKTRTESSGSVLGAFFDSFSPEIAYAQSGSSSLAGADNLAFYPLYLILFLLSIGPYFYYKHIKQKGE